jgi:hypothetical protein
VYQAVRERIEEDARLHAERIAGWSVDPADHPYPMQRVLDAMRAGEATDVPSWAVPKSARADHCTARGRRTGQTVEAAVFYKAVVRPDDSVTFEVDDGGLWFEEIGL